MKQITRDPETHEFRNNVNRSRYLQAAIRSNMKPSLMVRINRLKSAGMNVIISIPGETGVGKSTVAWVIAEWILNVYKKEMVSDNMFFDDGRLLKSLETSVEGDVKVKDEQPDTYGMGSRQVSSQLQNIEATVRKGEVSLIYCSPEVAIHSHHYIIYPVLQLWHKENKDMFTKIKNRNQVLSWVFKTTRSWNLGQPMGCIFTGLPKGTTINEKFKMHKKKIVFSKEYKKYLKMKDEFISDVKHGRVSSGSEFFLDDAAKEFIKNENLMEFRKVKDILTALRRPDKPYNRNFTTGQLDTIKEFIKVKCTEGSIEKGWKD